MNKAVSMSQPNKLLKVNLHTHTVFCDGKNTAEEMVLSAIDKGFDVIGFSGHSYTPFDESYCMSIADTDRYIQEIHRLREKYKDKISVFCGIEQDYYSDQPTDMYDYVIGSVHAFYKELGEKQDYIYVDNNIDIIKQAALDFYDGDFLALAEDYFAAVAKVAEKTHCHIIGHFDLLTKFNELDPVFDENHPRYIEAVDKALSTLLPTGAIFEINTGAISKKYRTTPYPSANILKKIKEGGGRITLNSDSHATDTLDCGFAEALQLARSCGFTELWILSPDGLWIPQSI